MPVLELTDIPTLDTTTVQQYYRNYGLNTELLDKCNSQEFKFIDGYGVGYFLTLSEHYTNHNTSLGEKVTLTIDSITRSLFILEKYDLAIPAITKKLSILKLAEPKFYLKSISVNRNFNVIDRRYLNGSTAPLVSPDTTAKTMKQIIEEIVGFTISYNAPVYYPYDVFIQGMTALDAIDKLCASVGLLWTFNRVSSTNTLTIWSVSTPATIDTTIVSDIADQIISDPLRQIAIAFPILDCCQQYPNSYKSVFWDGALAGAQATAYMPYYPATVDPEGNTTNSASLSAVASAMRTQFQGIVHIENSYTVQPKLNPIDLMAKPPALKVTFADYGGGPLTIYSGDKYPFIPVPVPPTLDRQARNWVGYLYQEYKGNVPGFWVIPAFGIDGLPPLVNQYVINLYSWNYGDAGAAVRVEWDCVNYRWIPLQQEYVCPPTYTPDPPDPPPSTPSHPDIDFLE